MILAVHRLQRLYKQFYSMLFTFVDMDFDVNLIYKSCFKQN